MSVLDALSNHAFVQTPGLTAFYARGLATLLAGRDLTLLVSSLPAGRLVVVRTAEGDSLSLQVVAFDRISGLAVERERMAVATVGTQVWLLASEAAESGARFDCRSSIVTGEIATHEIAWGADGLWLVNTRYSCLCTPDSKGGVAPRWRPPFITELLPEDRCHLNGLAVVDGAPKYVTCFSRTDTASGWRRDPSGGCLLDIPSSGVVLADLTMPHSPRVHDGRIFLLDSGTGRLLKVDPDSGDAEPVAEFDGFLRGLAFSGSLAFVGLSKTRHLKMGLPLVRALGESPGRCGVWVVDIEDGRTVAFLELVQGIDEVFDVQLVSGLPDPIVLGPPRRC